METIKRWWFYISAVAVFVIYFLFDRRGRKIEELKDEAVRNRIGAELSAIADKAAGSAAEYDAAKARYLDIKRRHPGLFGRIEGVRPGPDTGGPSSDGQ